MRVLAWFCVIPLAATVCLWGQASLPPPQPEHSGPQPIYTVTVVSRTLQAVNYEHRGGPTTIDFAGTVLMPKAKGQAIVESKRGSVSVDVRFERMEPPSKFGPEYLTYVLWAISPEGRPKNLGEVLASSSDKAHLAVSAGIQAFGMIVTAEPYYAVTTPSDVVVLENEVRPDTIGTREPITARYELLPRGQYTMTLHAAHAGAAQPSGEKLPYDRYEALLEIYQAQNALQIARSEAADRYAPESFQKAATLLENARAMYDRKGDTHAIVSSAREAAQTAEDARAIAARRAQEEHGEQARRDESRVRLQSERDAVLAQAQAEAERAEAERAQVEAARRQLDEARSRDTAREAIRRPAPMPPVTTAPQQTQAVPPSEAIPGHNELTPEQRDSRAAVLHRLSAALSARDTPRGLVATVPGSFFDKGGEDLRPGAAERLMQVASLLSTQSGLSARVEAYTDSNGPAAETETQRSAHRVRALLIEYGADPNAIIAAGLGDSRPVASNATAEGRSENRRVEIVIAGASIGEMPLWERTYSLQPRR